MLHRENSDCIFWEMHITRNYTVWEERKYFYTSILVVHKVTTNLQKVNAINTFSCSY